MKDWRDILPTRGSTGTPDWSAEDDGRLRLMWAEGVPVKCIARELKRKIPAIHYRATVLELPRRCRTNAAKPKPKPPPVIAVVPVQISTVHDWAGERFAKAMVAAGLRFEDDPRAAGEFDLGLLPAARRGDMTASLMGDPASGRSTV